MIKKITTFCLCLGMAVALQAQQAERFSVATLNIDGLPKKILVVNSNPDGPGGPGTVRIGNYFMKRGYDMMFMQEDFSYHGELAAVLEDIYNLDTWSGTVGIDLPDKKIDFLHLQNLQFECDGLMGAWKSGITVSGGQRTAWTDGFGKFSHAADLLVTKGFRRYEVTLASGTAVVVYNLHMDAEAEEDTEEGKSGPDRAARLNQWKQLRDAVMQSLDNRPVIILGDFNTFYFRDKVKETVIDDINASGKATVKDAWVELKNNGQYPAYEEDNRIRDNREAEHKDEPLDKVLYINPTGAEKILRAASYERDTVTYKYDGKALGDHYPVSVTFEVVNVNDPGPSGISSISSATESEGTREYYNTSGQRVSNPKSGLYIERTGRQARKRIVKR
jgi:endonuclease/exonuclease/phosphatase family metal-dependent hydrolase